MSTNNNDKNDENQDSLWNNGYFPKKINSYEQIIITFRQDLSILTEQAVLGFALFIFILVLKIIFFGNVSDDSISYLLEGLVFGFGAIEIVIFAYFFHNHFLSQTAITTKRIIEIRQEGLLFTRINQHLIENFRTIKVDRDRARYVLGDKGHITIEMKEVTNLPKLQIEHVPKPEEVEKIIKGLMS
jgi:hypothetical protein